MFVEAYFETATYLFEQYDLQLPLPLFLKNYFKSNKKFGSRDRKIIAELLYGIFRLGKNNDSIFLRDRMLYGSFLTGKIPIVFFQKTNEKLAFNYAKNEHEKIQFLKETNNIQFEIEYAFSMQYTTSSYLHYLYSMASVFIRIRKGKEEILAAFKKNAIVHHLLNESCVQLPANTKLDELNIEEENYIIQDFSTQQIAKYFIPQYNEAWWDCCAASGGKSLLLLDKYKNIQLTVSDIRESILHNLKKRFQVYHPTLHYHSFAANIADEHFKIDKKFDKIICDVPCSGSGTWRSNPEQFYFFTSEKLNEFTTKQFLIANNALRFLNEKGLFYYITCSVFKQENEEIVTQLLNENKHITLTEMQLIQGADEGGNNLFIAILQNG